jgi:phage shock protein C
VTPTFIIHQKDTTMNLADELQKLQTLRDQGTLTEEEFTKAKRFVLEGRSPNGEAKDIGYQSRSMLHKLRRSTADRWVAGVAGGLAETTNVPAWSWRVLFLLTALLHGLGLVLYVLLWIFVPLAVHAPMRLAPPDERP